MKSVLMFTSVIQHLDRESATPYVRSVATKIMEFLGNVSEGKVNIDSDYNLVKACIHMAVSLVALADESKRKYTAISF